MKILIVDDSPVDSRLIKEIISKDGIVSDFLFADSGEAALRMAENNDFNIVVMDILMHGMNGFESAKLIKKLKPNVKIVIITNAEDEIHPERVKESGIDLYTSKKLMDYTLPQAIRRLTPSAG